MPVDGPPRWTLMTVTGISATAQAGLNANDVTTAQTLLSNLSGTIGSVQQQLFVNSPTATDWTDYRSGILFRRNGTILAQHRLEAVGQVDGAVDHGKCAHGDERIVIKGQ